MDFAASLELWEAVRDGHLGRAGLALQKGADVNWCLSCSVDESTGQRTWDFFGDGHYTWRHVITVGRAHLSAGGPAPDPEGLVVPCDGDTMLHVAAKLQWRALLKLLATRVELNEFIANAFGQTARDCAAELARSQLRRQWSEGQRKVEKNEFGGGGQGASVSAIVGESRRLMREGGSAKKEKGPALALFDACLSGEGPAPAREPWGAQADWRFYPRPAHLYETQEAISAAGARSQQASRFTFAAARGRMEVYAAIDRARQRCEEGPIFIAPHVEQPRDQPDPMPRGNDETVVPRFPRGQRVPVELPYRSWRAPTLNENAGTIFSSPTKSVSTVTHLMRRSYGEQLQQLRDDMVGKRFLVLRPTSSLVTVKRIAELGDEHAVTFTLDGGDIGDQTKHLSWFKANSRKVQKAQQQPSGGVS
jgi:hypothetical protein